MSSDDTKQEPSSRESTSELSHSAQSALNAHLTVRDPQPMTVAETPRTFSRQLVDFLFGYDFFISYAWHYRTEDGQSYEDGRAYAISLNEQLGRRGFQCFLDSKEYRPGNNWRIAGRLAIRKSSQLILIVTRGAILSEPVQREIEAFRTTNRDIISIDCEGILEQRGKNLKRGLPTATSHVLNLLNPDVLFIPEEPDRLIHGPSECVLQRHSRGLSD